jgi:hypothetical protein
VESHRLREDYLISRRHANNQATRYVLNPQLIEKAFDFSQGAERAALWQERVTMCCNKCALEKDRTTRASDEKFRASERANERTSDSSRARDRVFQHDGDNGGELGTDAAAPAADDDSYGPGRAMEDTDRGDHSAGEAKRSNQRSDLLQRWRGTRRG